MHTVWNPNFGCVGQLAIDRDARFSIAQLSMFLSLCSAVSEHLANRVMHRVMQTDPVTNLVMNRLDWTLKRFLKSFESNVFNSFHQ